MMDSSLSSERPLVAPRPSSRFTSSSSGTSNASMWVMGSLLEFSMSSNASAWAWVRGNPSKMKPLASRWASILLRIMPITMWSSTSSPWSMSSWAARPNWVSALISARSRSPVLRCTRSYRSIRKALWVPLPAPGGPKRMRFSLLISYLSMMR